VVSGVGSSRGRATWVLLLVLLGAELPAAAQTAESPGSPGNPEARRAAIYAEAAAAASAGRWAEARDRLRTVLAIRSSPKVLFSLAQAEEQLGAVASAWADYGKALEGAKAAGEGDVVAAAVAATRSIERRVPHVRVVVTGVAGTIAATTTLDDRPIALDTAVAVDPGEHRVTVVAPGMVTSTASVTVAEGQQVELPIRLARQPDVASPPPAPVVSATLDHPAMTAAPAPPVSTAGPWPTIGVIVAGAGIVTLGVGAGFGVESIVKHGDAQKACPGSTCADASGVSLWHDAVTAGNVSTLAIALGGALTAGGIVVWLMAPRSSYGGATVGVGPGFVQVGDTW
jgi:hypothetical protein